MATRKQATDASKDNMQQKIAEETQAFLKAGGKIDMIPQGQSGVDNKPKSAAAAKTEKTDKPEKTEKAE